MDPRDRIVLICERLDQTSYYRLLGVGPAADGASLQQAFHSFALAWHPDRHVDQDASVREQVRVVFQRGVEAYTVLRNPRAARLYQQAFGQGRMRLSPEELERLSRPEPKPEPKRQPQGFAGQMKTAEGKEIAARVERLMAQGRYPEAYQQLDLLEMTEGDNEAVRQRLAQVSRMVKARR